ncbi:MAG: leucine-rich repeat domain-containing protein [Promethearchaeota archaeon]
MPSLTLKQIVDSYLIGEIDKSSLLSYIISLIETCSDEKLRLEALEFLNKSQLKSELVFKFLENLLISDESHLIKAYSAKFLITNFPKKAYSPLFWALRNLEWPLFNGHKNNALSSILKQLRKVKDTKLLSLLRLKEHISYQNEIFFPNNGVLNLQDLNINKISEIEGLQSLTDLKELNLTGNNISEINNLENLANLKKLNLSGNYITEIKGLDSLKQLNHLYLQNNNIAEIKGLNNLKNLHFLNLENNNITEIKNLHHNVNLTTLYLNNNEINEVKNLDYLHELYFLALNNNNIKEIKGLGTLRNLRILQLAGNKIQEIKGLGNLKKLTNLNLYNNVIKETKDPNLPNLYFFSLDNNKIPKFQLKEFYKKHRKFRYFHYF